MTIDQQISETIVYSIFGEGRVQGQRVYTGEKQAATRTNQAMTLMPNDGFMG
jgi:hypothetical protein